MGRRRPRRIDWKVLLPSLLYLGLAGLFLFGSGLQTVAGKVVFLLVVGVALALRPPKAVPHLAWNVAVGGFLLWTLLQLVPGTAQSSGWRETLAWAGALPQPTAAALAPGAQLVAFLFLLAVAGALALAAEVNGGLDAANRRRALEAFGLFFGLVGAIVGYLNFIGLKNPVVSEAHVFTFLANRNLLALLCAMGGVVCVALSFERILRHPVEGGVFLLAAFGALAGQLSLLSRASFLLYFLGLACWFAASVKRGSLRERLKMVVPLALLLVSGVFIFGEQVVRRLLDFVSSDPTIGQAGPGRLAIFRDTFELLPSVFWTGSGWDTFYAVIGPFRRRSLSDLALYHPENDYLWLWVEAGVIGVFFAVLLLVSLAGRPLARWTALDRYQKIAWIVVGMVFVQGLVDTPLHSLTVMLFVFWLIGLGQREGGKQVRPLCLGPRSWQALGGGLVVAGLVVAWGAWAKAPWLRGTVERESAQMVRVGAERYEGVDDPRAWLASARLRQPLVWTVHTAEARWHLADGEREAAAAAFQRARLVRRERGIVTLTEARLWFPLTDGATLNAWRETFLERELYDRVPNFQRALVNTGPGRPGLYRGLARISRRDPALRRNFLQLGGRGAADELRWEWSQDPNLEAWSVVDRRWLLRRATELLGWSEVADHLRAHPALAEVDPVFFVVTVAQVEGWEEGGAVFLQQVAAPAFNPYGADWSLGEIRARFRLRPGDVANATAYLRSLALAGEWESFIEVLATFRRSPGARVPPEFDYWLGRAYWETGAYAEAGRAFLRYYDAKID